MQISVKNRSSQSLGHLESYLKSFLPFAQKRMGFNRPPSIFFDSDEQNSKNVLGKTAHYNPESMEVVVYVDGRHPKDVIRSLSHELVHHTQNCRGDLNSDVAGETELGYAQNNPHMRNMESEAYEKGNLCMRDWEDSVKVHLQETNYYQTKGDGKQMDKYKQIVETVAKRVATRIKEGNFKKIDNNLEEGFMDQMIAKCEERGGTWTKGEGCVGGEEREMDHPPEELDEKRRIRQGNEDRARGDVPADRIREGEEEELDEGNGHPMMDQMIDQCEERGGTWNGDASSPDWGCSKAGDDYSDGARANAEAGAEFTGRSEIKESNDQWYQRNLFENLIKKWTK